MFGLRKRTWIIGSIVAVLIGTTAVASRYSRPSMEERADFATYMITKKLELNDEQEAQLDKLAESWIGSTGTLKSFRKSLLDDVKTLAVGESLSVEQVNGLRDKIKAEIDQRADQLIPQFVAFYNGLDQAQKAKIVARLDDVSSRMDKPGSSDRNKRRHRRHHHWFDGE